MARTLQVAGAPEGARLVAEAGIGHQKRIHPLLEADLVGEIAPATRATELASLRRGRLAVLDALAAARLVALVDERGVRARAAVDVVVLAAAEGVDPVVP